MQQKHLAAAGLLALFPALSLRAADATSGLPQLRGEPASRHLSHKEPVHKSRAQLPCSDAFSSSPCKRQGSIPSPCGYWRCSCWFRRALDGVLRKQSGQRGEKFGVTGVSMARTSSSALFTSVHRINSNPHAKQPIFHTLPRQMRTLKGTFGNGSFSCRSL